MEKSPALDIVCAYQDAWTSGNLAAAARYVADDIVFRSPQQHLTSAHEFMAMLGAFAGRVERRWELVAATPDPDGVLILYKLFLGGAPALCADHFTVRDGRIQSETLVFDPQPFAAPAGPGRA
jgi:ketosteroid isomerase-like protein